MIQILLFKPCTIRFVFRKEDFCTQEKYNFSDKGVINKGEEDFYTRDCKSQNENLDSEGIKNLKL